MSHIFVSSPHIGGIFRINFKNGHVEIIKNGNVRGLFSDNDKLYYVKGDKNTVYNQLSELFSFEGNGSLHDIKLFENNFFIMSTLDKRLLKFDNKGNLLKEMKFDDCYWPNCCIVDDVTKNIIVFLSAKRPYSKSKIICMNQNWDLLWEFICLEGDEIHSPFIDNGVLYWCRSNRNGVACGTLSLYLKDFKKVLINDSGYTRGLLIEKNHLFLGTSENRHAETSLCNSNINNGCIHCYVKKDNSFILENTIVLESKEVYDIVNDKNTVMF